MKGSARVVFLKMGLLLSPCIVYATPIFQIIPNQPLPTEIFPGQSTKAYYSVTNNSKKSLSGSFVKYLPKNVTQITDDALYSDLCRSKFNLGPVGASNSSCVLELMISGPVNAADPNTRNHLWVCASDATSCSQAQVELNVRQSSTPLPIAIEVGQYQDNSYSVLPLIYNSLNNGATWQSVSIQDPTNFYNNAALASVVCNNLYCITAGGYGNNTGGTSPLLAKSNDRGNSWQYITNSSLPTGIDPRGTSGFNSINCSQSFCLAGGWYDTTSNTTVPLLARSNDFGKTWTYIYTLPSGFDDTGIIDSVSCSGTFCVLAGSYENTSQITRPLLATSTDSGATWSYVTQLPSDFSGDAAMINVNCNGNSCIVSGNYLNKNGEVTPLLINLVYANGIINWSYFNGKPTNYQGAGVFAQASCNKNTCVAGGQYLNDNSEYVPMLAQSLNKGKTWSYISTAPADFGENGAFLGVNCNSKTCLAIGSYINTNNEVMPMFSQSLDNGSTWDYLDLSPENYADYGILSHVNCNGAFCVAGGSYMNDDGQSIPLLVQSVDQGVTWSIVSIALPTGFKNLGELSANAVFSSASSWSSIPSSASNALSLDKIKKQLRRVGA